jgi:hypothetical protein
VSSWTRGINVAALTIAVGLALGTIVGGVKAVNSPGVSPCGVPFRTIDVMSFVLATVLLLAAIGDVRIMRSGMPRGGPRLARHLWRMCFALFIAAGSFFSIRECVAKIFPNLSRLGRCARCRSCRCLARCSIGCGGPAAAARCQCSSGTIRCLSSRGTDDPVAEIVPDSQPNDDEYRVTPQGGRIEFRRFRYTP